MKLLEKTVEVLKMFIPIYGDIKIHKFACKQREKYGMTGSIMVGGDIRETGVPEVIYYVGKYSALYGVYSLLS